MRGGGPGTLSHDASVFYPLPELGYIERLGEPRQAFARPTPPTMSKPRFQRMSQEQETQLGHNCALDIYSDPQAFRKVRAPSHSQAATAARELRC